MHQFPPCLEFNSYCNLLIMLKEKTITSAQIAKVTTNCSSLVNEVGRHVHTHTCSQTPTAFKRQRACFVLCLNDQNFARVLEKNPNSKASYAQCRVQNGMKTLRMAPSSH